jgi:hypothetical protein
VYAGRKGGDYVTDPECCLGNKKSTTLAPKNNEKLEATITVELRCEKHINAIREDPKRTNEIFRAAFF